MPRHMRFGPDLPQELYDAIKLDNEREDNGMHADDRTTCWSHQSLAEDCEDQHNRR